MYINQKELNRTGSVKFLGVLFVENLKWNNDIHLNQNEIAINIAIYIQRFMIPFNITKL